MRSLMPLPFGCVAGILVALFTDGPVDNKSARLQQPLDCAEVQTTETPHHTSNVDLMETDRQPPGTFIAAPPKLVPEHYWQDAKALRLEEQFQAEAIDLAWAPGVSFQIFDAIQTVDLGFIAQEVECRTAICRVELGFVSKRSQPMSGPEVGDVFIPILESDRRLNGVTGRIGEETGLAIYYLHNDGRPRLPPVDEKASAAGLRFNNEITTNVEELRWHSIEFVR